MQARRTRIWAGTHFEDDFLIGTSDGSLRVFNVTRDNWVTFQDSTGSYQIPLNATLLIEVRYTFS